MGHGRMLTETEFDQTYQELLAEHVAGDCPVDCAFCEEDRPPREIDPDEGEPLVVELGLKRRSAQADETYIRTGKLPGYRFTFGKHKGESLAQVPRQYLDWVLLLDASDRPKDLWIRQAKNAIRRYLGEAIIPEPTSKRHRKKNRHRRSRGR